MTDLQKLIEDLTSGDETRAETAALQIAIFNDEALEILAPLLDSPNPDIRWWVIRALVEIENPAVPALLATKLNDEALEIRQCAALALRKQPHIPAIPQLIKELSSQDSLMARLAGDALLSIGQSSVLPLIEILKNGKQQARIEAARTLALIEDQRAIPALYSVLNEDSAILEYWANDGLNRMGVGMVIVKP